MSDIPELRDISVDDLKAILEYVAPNLRFGASFLNTKYRDRAVNDEVMMDKTTGELTYKRNSDGDFVHYHRENILLSDWAMQIQTLYAEDATRKRPTKENCTEYDTTYLLGTLYDLQSFRWKESVNTLIEEGASLVNSSTTPFNVTHEANGFFVRLMVRPRDVAVISMLSAVYDRYFSSYTGDNSFYATEKQKLEDNPEMLGKNACINYTVTYYRGGNPYRTENFNGFINVQQVCYLPVYVTDPPTRENTEYITININEIMLPKVSMALRVKEFAFSNEELELYEKIRDADKIGLKYMEVFNYTTISDPTYYAPDKSNSRIYSLVRMEDAEKAFRQITLMTTLGITIDTELDATSNNPIANAIVTENINNLNELINNLNTALTNLSNHVTARNSHIDVLDRDPAKPDQGYVWIVKK